MRALLLLVSLTLLRAPLLQEPATTTTVADEIAALIEKTNALESFHAIYDMTRSEEKGGAMTLEFAYRAPDLGVARVHGSEMDVEVWMLGTDFYVRQGETWKRTSLEPPPFIALLDESFPSREHALGPGVTLMFRVWRDASNSGSLQITFADFGAGRTSVLGWLSFMKAKAASQLTSEGPALRWEDDGMRLVVSRTTGMLEEVFIANSDGDGTVRLRECQFDAEVDPALTRPPSEALVAALDPKIAGSYEQMPAELRKLALLRIEGCLAADMRTWNDVARTDSRAVLASMHRQIIEHRYTDWRAKTREWMDRAVEAAREKLDANDSAENRATVVQYLADIRTGLEKSTAGAGAAYAESLVAIETSRNAPRQELYDLERAVVSELWAEIVADPLLTTCDQASAEVLKH